MRDTEKNIGTITYFYDSLLRTPIVYQTLPEDQEKNMSACVNLGSRRTQAPRPYKALIHNPDFEEGDIDICTGCSSIETTAIYCTLCSNTACDTCRIFCTHPNCDLRVCLDCVFVCRFCGEIFCKGHTTVCPSEMICFRCMGVRTI